jgi:UPF0755 protein
MTLAQFFQIGFLVLEMHLSRLKYFYLAFLVMLTLIVGSIWLVFFAAPAHFPVGQFITIDSGTSVSRAASNLRTTDAINSRLLFKALVRFMPGAHGVQSGKYVFDQPAGILAVAWNLTHGVSGIPTTRITFPEGTTVRQMGQALGTSIPGFDEQRFDSLALPAEGYLFPDTYFFLPDTTEVEAMDIMRANYDAHTKDLEPKFVAFGKSEREILTMASLLEGEGKTPEDKRVIAGILWHRIALGMPLQVDATFGYIYGKTGYVPTGADLKSNSAYNTYRYTGLPPTPINNPGDVSIEAAITPTKSDYLYYLTGDDGAMHYARTLAEHIANQKKYLK